MAGVAWSGNQAPEAKPAQHGTHRAFGQAAAEFGLDRADLVGPTPADDAASVRDLPSGTSAKANMRRDAATLEDRRAARRSPEASNQYA